MVDDERLVGFLNRQVVHVALRRERRLLVAAHRALIDRLAQRLDEHGEMTGEQVDAVLLEGEQTDLKASAASDRLNGRAARQPERGFFDRVEKKSQNCHSMSV